MMDVQQETAARSHDPRDVPEHLPAVLTPLNHSQRTEEANRVIGGAIGKAFKLDEVRTQRQDASGALNWLFQQHSQHRLT